METGDPTPAPEQFDATSAISANAANADNAANAGNANDKDNAGSASSLPPSEPDWPDLFTIEPHAPDDLRDNPDIPDAAPAAADAMPAEAQTAEAQPATSEATATQPVKVATAVAPAKKRSGRRRWRPNRRQIILMAAATLGVLIIAGFIGYTMFSAQIGALLVARNFCDAVQQQHYAKAYSYFAPSLQHQVSQDAFTVISEKGDALQGKVTGCSATGVSVTFGGQTVVVHSVVTRSIIGKQNDDLTLSLINGNWKISQSPDPLLLPLTVAYYFCQDAKAQNYATAYGYLAPSLQQQVSQDAFVTISNGNDALHGKVTDCNVTSVSETPDHKAVTVQSSVVRTSGSQPSTLHLALIKENWKISQSPDPLLLPLAAAVGFCNDLKAQNYTGAYGYFSPNLQYQIPQDAFVAISQGSDALNGTVSACNVSGVDMSADGNSVTVHSTLVRAKETQPSTLYLTQMSGEWKISQSPDPLLLPLAAAYAFCSDLKAQNYTAAYGYFAPSLQQAVSQDAFVAISQGADTLRGKVTACNVSGVQMSKDGNSVTVHSTLMRTIAGNQPGDLHLAQLNGSWKISQSPDPLLLPLTVAYYFCGDLETQNYSAAYSYFAPGLQAQVSQGAFVTISQGGDALQGKVLQCNVTGVQMDSSGTFVTVQSTVVRAKVTQASTLSLALIGNSWEISQSPDPLLLPLTSAYNFCQDLKAQNYYAAYTIFAPGLQSQVSQGAFVTILQGADTLQGRVTACNVTGVQMSGNGTIVDVQSTVVRSIIGAEASNLHLVLLGGSWKIGQSPDPLLLPLTSAYYFCQDLMAQNYNGAYNLMSASAQSQLGSPLSLQIVFGLAEAITGRLTGCNVTGVSFSNNGQALTVQSTLTFQRSSPLSSTVYEVLENGQWRIRQITMYIGGIPFRIPAS